MPGKIIRCMAAAAALGGIWYLLSGKTDWMHLGVGVAAAILLAVLYFPWKRASAFPLVAFVVYLPWLAWQIVLSNVRVARLALSPRGRAAPRFIRKKVNDLDDTRAQALLGCSVTLTPGTLTVSIDEQEMLVHALDASSAEDIENEDMARKVAGLFRNA